MHAARAVPRTQRLTLVAIYVPVMFMRTQPLSAEPFDAHDQRAADAQYYRGVLHALIDMGADLARLVHDQAKAQAEAAAAAEPGAEPAPDATVAFDRVARAVRRTVMLARTLDEPAPGAADDRGQQRIAARKLIIRRVEDAIHREAKGSERESLHAELLERLDAPDLDDDIRTLPIGTIIDEIRTDLGLCSGIDTGLWKRRTPADIATLYARAAAPPVGAARACLPELAGAVPPGGAAGGDGFADAGEDGGLLLLRPERFRGKG